MNLFKTWLILIASVAIVSDAAFNFQVPHFRWFPFRVPHALQALSPYDFNVTTDGSITDPASASVTLFVKPKGGSFGRKKREATETPDSEEQSLEERNGKVLFKPARWDFSPTSGAAVTVGALSAMSSLIWTIIHEAKKAKEAGITSDVLFPPAPKGTPTAAVPAPPSGMSSYGSSYGSQYAPSPYYPTYESSYYPAPPPKSKPLKIKAINPMKGLKAIQEAAFKGVMKLQKELNKAKPSKGPKKQKQKPVFYPYYPPAMASIPYYPKGYSQPSYPADQSYPVPPPSYPAPSPSYPADSGYPVPPPSYSVPSPSYPTDSSYTAPPPSYPAPPPSYPAPPPSYPTPPPSYPAPPPSYPAPPPSYPAPPPSYPAPPQTYDPPSYSDPAPSYAQQPEPVYPRDNVPTYGVPPTPAPYVPTQAPDIPTPAPYAPTPAVVPVYGPPTTKPPTMAPSYNPPPPPPVTQVPIQYESFIPIAPSPPKPRQLYPPIALAPPTPDEPVDMAIVPSPIDPTPFDPSPEEAEGVWSRPSEQVMTWLLPEMRASNTTNEPDPSVTESPRVTLVATPLPTIAITPSSIAQDSSNTTTTAY